MWMFKLQRDFQLCRIVWLSVQRRTRGSRVLFYGFLTFCSRTLYWDLCQSTFPPTVFLIILKRNVKEFSKTRKYFSLYFRSFINKINSNKIEHTNNLTLNTTSCTRRSLILVYYVIVLTHVRDIGFRTRYVRWPFTRWGLYIIHRAQMASNYVVAWHI